MIVQPEKIPEESGKPPPVGQKSPLATNPQSTGAILPESFWSFSGFIYVVSFAWVSASFEDWSAKCQLTESIAKTIADSAPLLPEDKPTLRASLESHLDQLSLDKLHTLNALMKDYPDEIKGDIYETLRNPSQDFHNYLAEITTPRFTDEIRKNLKSEHDDTV